MFSGCGSFVAKTPESMTDAAVDTSCSLTSGGDGEIAEGGGEALASVLDAAAVPGGPLVCVM